MRNKALKLRLIDILYKYKLSHVGSCLTAIDIIDHIYSIKKKDEKFVCSQGHAGLALYCVIEKYEGIDAEAIFNHHGIHPERCPSCHLDVSSGSLGLATPIAVGMALADRTKNVYVLESDGGMAEGSNYEALAIAAENKLSNLHIFFNLNGYSAYKEVDREKLISKINSFKIDSNPNTYYCYTQERLLPFFIQGLDAHYVILDEHKYLELKDIYK